jgi:cytochrome P450
MSYVDIPRPPHHPLLGHLPRWLGKRNAERILDTLLEYGEQCGPLARIPLGPARVLLVSDPEPIAQLLSAEEANVKGWPYRLTRVVLDNVLLLNGEAWARHRNLYRRALRGADVMRAGDAALEAFVPRTLARVKEIDLYDAVRELTADCVMQLLCSTRFPKHLDADRARVQYELAAVGIDLQCQPWAYFSPQRWTAMRRSVETMRAFFLEQVERGGEGSDVLGGFRALAASGDIEDDPRALRDGLVNLFFTAHDVLTSSAAFFLYLLAKHPAVQDEIRAALPKTDDDLDSIEPLACALRESLRLYPGYPLFSRRTRAPLRLGRFDVPAGTDVIVSPWVLHRLERHWPDARGFHPERWRARERKIGPGPRGAYMPFGGGHRSCIAFALAFPLIELIAARVLRTFRLRAPPDHEPDIVYWGSASSANGLPASIDRV